MYFCSCRSSDWCLRRNLLLPSQGLPNDRLPPTGRTSRHLQHRFVRGLSPHSLFKPQSRLAHTGATRTYVFSYYTEFLGKCQRNSAGTDVQTQTNSFQFKSKQISTNHYYYKDQRWIPLEGSHGTLQEQLPLHRFSRGTAEGQEDEAAAQQHQGSHGEPGPADKPGQAEGDGH